MKYSNLLITTILFGVFLSTMLKDISNGHRRTALTYHGNTADVTDYMFAQSHCITLLLATETAKSTSHAYSHIL